MNVADGLRKHGFRRWYERQLIESHLYLVTFLLAIIMTASGFELLAAKTTAFDLLFDTTLIVSGLAIAWYAWRRYSLLMMVAEHVGGQAFCPQCGNYGFKLEPGRSRRPLAAYCRKCSARWDIDPGI